MKNIKYLIIGIALFVLMPFSINASEKVNVYFFYSETCSFCTQQTEYLESIKEDKNLVINYYNVANESNYNAMVSAKSLYGIDSDGVPFAVIGDEQIVGFSESMLDSAIESYNDDDPELLKIIENISAIETVSSEKVNVYFFYTDTCSFCKQEREYLESIKEEKNLEIYSYNLAIQDNDEIMTKTKSLYNIDTTAVPFTVIGNKPILGFVKTEIDAAIESYTEDNEEVVLAVESGVRSTTNSSANANTSVMLIFFGVIVVGLIFLLKPEKKRG